MKTMKLYWIATWLTLISVTVLLMVACSPQPTSPQTPKPTTIPQPPSPRTVIPPATAQERELAQMIEAAKKEGKLTAYSFSFIGDIGLALQKGFESRYGIPLEIISGRGAEMGERIKTERRIGNVVADFMESSPTNVTNLKDGGATVSTKDLPVFQEKDVWRVDPLINDAEGHLLGHRAMNLGPYINTNLVKPGEEPKSYKDVLASRWDGKILLSDPNVSSGSYDLFVTLMENKRLDLDTVKALGLRAKFVAGTRQIAEALARGEFPLGLTISDNDSASFLAEGAPIKAVAMQEGIMSLSSAMARVKDGPHPNATRLFMNWMFTQEGQTVYTRVIGLMSVRKDVADSRHPGARVDVPLFPQDQKIASKTAQLFREKYLVNLWKK